MFSEVFIVLPLKSFLSVLNFTHDKAPAWWWRWRRHIVCNWIRTIDPDTKSGSITYLSSCRSLTLLLLIHKEKHWIFTAWSLQRMMTCFALNLKSTSAFHNRVPLINASEQTFISKVIYLFEHQTSKEYWNMLENVYINISNMF